MAARSPAIWTFDPCLMNFLHGLNNNKDSGKGSWIHCHIILLERESFILLKHEILQKQRYIQIFSFFNYVVQKTYKKHHIFSKPCIFTSHLNIKMCQKHVNTEHVSMQIISEYYMDIIELKSTTFSCLLLFRFFIFLDSTHLCIKLIFLNLPYF